MFLFCSVSDFAFAFLLVGIEVFRKNTSLRELNVTECFKLLKQVEEFGRAICSHPSLEQVIVGSIFKQNLDSLRKLAQITSAAGKNMELIAANGVIWRK